MIETPLGHLNFYIDGNPIDCEVNEIENDKSCAKLSGRYYVVIHFEPDGKRHCISCCIDEYTPSEKDSMESGERLELKSFYSESAKLSIGMEGDAGYMPDGRRISEYDYDNDYLENGVQYEILPITKTTKFIFGIAWIDHVNVLNDVQTWYGADPTLIQA